MNIAYLILLGAFIVLCRCRTYATSIEENQKIENLSSMKNISFLQNDELPRLLSDSAINKISETLGVLNHVGHFLVDMTRGGSTESTTISMLPSITPPSIEDSSPVQVESSKENASNNNITNNYLDDIPKKNSNKNNKSKTIVESMRKEAASIYSFRPSTEKSGIDRDNKLNKEVESTCKTPDGKIGRCEDLSSCPALLLNLNGLRESLCFKSLFVPGVCCPLSQDITTKSPIEDFITSTKSTNLVLIPQIELVTTTKPTSLVIKPLNTSGVFEIGDCGQQESTAGRIVGGVESQNGQWPWMAAIFLHGPKRTEFWCGGSLIGDRYILTAAHCTRDSRQRPFAARQFTVRLGDIDLSTDEEPSEPVTFAVKEVRAHDKFSRIGFYNDIAILVLDGVVRKSKYVIPLCLPENFKDLQTNQLIGKRATVVGWGTTYYGGKESTKQRQADLPIWRNDDCDKAYFQPINENFVCAGYSDGGVDACQGDSGGPLMIRFENRWTQLGIVSFGNKCGEPGYPGVYTRVSQYIGWIKNNIKN